MNESLVTVKAAIAAFFTALGAFLGWKWIIVLVWLAAMLLDYLSGSAAAIKAGQWSSAVAREGAYHKGGMIFVVLVAGTLDLVMTLLSDHVPLGFKWPVIVLPLVVTWYIITELGSILENAVKLGATVPTWLTRMLKASLNAVDAVVDISGELNEKQTAEDADNGTNEPEVQQEE